MASLSSHITVTVTANSVGPARAGFGTPMIPSHTASWAERVRSYSDYAAVLADWDDDSPEARAANGLFAQDPKPTKVKIGRANGAVPTQQYTIGQVALRNSYKYEIFVEGEDFTAASPDYTSDGSATAAEIHNGLVTALNAVTGKNFTAVFASLVVADFNFTADNTTDILTAAAHTLQTGDGPFQLTNSGGALPAGLSTLTDYWIIRLDANTFQFATSLANALAGTFVNFTTNGTGTHTAADTVNTKRPSDPFLVNGNAPGAWFSLECDPNDLACEQSHADPGIAAELAAIQSADSDWYALVTLYNSNAYALAAAAWAAANSKVYLCDVENSKTVTQVLGAGGTDTADDLKALNYERAAAVYHSSPAAMLAARWAGTRLTYTPGKATWKWAQPQGVSPPLTNFAKSLTDTQRTNLLNKRANTLENVAGFNVMVEGTTANASRFIDTRRDLDWLADAVQKNVLGALLSNPKIVLTSDSGINVVVGKLEGVGLEAVREGVAVGGANAPVVTAPRASELTADDIAQRRLPGLKLSLTLAHGLHKVDINVVTA